MQRPAGSFIKDKESGELKPDLNDKAMKARHELEKNKPAVKKTENKKEVKKYGS